MATRLVRTDDLPHSGTAHRFDGHAFGDVGVSFFVTDAPPGTGPRLHRHPYAEVFVVQEGRVVFTVGGEAIEATGGQIVIVPAGQPHKFVNAGPGPARHLDIHASGRMITEWLEQGTGLSPHTAADLRRIADTLNRRPRPPLDLDTPADRPAAPPAEPAAGSLLDERAVRTREGETDTDG